MGRDKGCLKFKGRTLLERTATQLEHACGSETLRPPLAAAEQTHGGCLLQSSDSGHIEPLCAVNHRNYLPAIRSALDRGVGKISDALTAAPVSHSPIRGLTIFQSMNTPTDWEALNE